MHAAALAYRQIGGLRIPDTQRPSCRYGVVMELEYQRLYFPPGTDRRTALTLLTMHAEFGDWELDRHRVFPDGSHRLVLRRRRSPGSLPGYVTT